MSEQRPRGLRRWTANTAVLAATVALLASACTDTPAGAPRWDDPDTTPTTEAAMAQVALSDAAEDAEFAVRPSVEQVSVTGAEPGVELVLLDADDQAVALGSSDEQGSLVFRQVEPGSGYRVATVDAQDDPDDVQVVSEAVDVVSVEASTPEQSFYDAQTLEPGFGYIETRDGTTLSVSVFLPGPVEDGPYPTVVEYSGYSPSKPGTNLIEARWDELSQTLPEGLTVEAVCQLAPFACNAPDQPASLLANALGYAVVAVNIRGTGCSGGSYDFFEPLQLLDGYDVIETVAAQDWVKGNQVGMVGLSYPGISQVFVASAQPPSLAAITPLSIYDDTVRGVLAPGGIFNDGFALQWAENVLDEAEPYGQGWEQGVVDAGDTTCADNQVLRGQNVDAVQKARSYPNYVPEIADPLSFEKIGPQVQVPVFYSSSFQDEQVGGRAPLMFDDLTNAPVVRLNAWNGAHVDGFAPQNLVEWKTFMDLYVNGEQTPRPAAFEIFAPIVMEQAFGVSVPIPPQRTIAGDDIAEQRATYESEPPVRVLLENGAGDPEVPGAPIATAEVLAETWPLPGTTPVSYWFGPDGTLSTEPPADDAEPAASRFEVDPELARTSSFADVEDNDPFHADAKYDWRQEPAGSAAVYVSEPLTEDQPLIGSASADLWVRSSYQEADLGVTLSEVRPDGSETYIQSGVLRGTHRKTTAASTPLLPLMSGLAEDAEPFPTDEFVEARVEIFPFAHVVRAGSRIRISVHTPGGDKVRWTYILAEVPDDAVVDVGQSGRYPSKLVLPLVPTVTDYPDRVPENCNALRAQPCREFEEYPNTSAE
jgi:predicted acyl esterase